MTGSLWWQFNDFLHFLPLFYGFTVSVELQTDGIAGNLYKVPGV